MWLEPYTMKAGPGGEGLHAGASGQARFASIWHHVNQPKIVNCRHHSLFPNNLIAHKESNSNSFRRW